MKPCRVCGGDVPLCNVRWRIYYCRPCNAIRLAPARAKYAASAKNRARNVRFNQSPRGRARNRRYLQSEKHRACSRKSNAKRLKIGRQWAGYAQTVEQAQAINAHIRDRVRAFRQAQQEAHVAVS